MVFLLLQAIITDLGDAAGEEGGASGKVTKGQAEVKVKGHFPRASIPTTPSSSSFRSTQGTILREVKKFSPLGNGRERSLVKEWMGSDQAGKGKKLLFPFRGESRRIMSV